MSLLRRLGRPLLVRCPHCGAAWRRRRWFELSPACAGCGLRLERGEPDHWTGALCVNLLATGWLLVGGLVLTLIVTWPRPPWRALYWGGIPLVVLVPFLTYPVAKLLWLAIDLTFRPAGTPTDFAPRGEARER